MKKLIALLVLGSNLWGCKKEIPPEPKVENVATRSAAGLVTATEKAKLTVEKANKAITTSQAASDAMAQEVQ